jgi:hypothetical protein
LAFHSGRESENSPLSSAEVKEWRGAVLGGAEGQIYLYLK